MFFSDVFSSPHQPELTTSGTLQISAANRVIQSHFTTEDYFLSALQMANISIPLTLEPMKLTGDDGWESCRQETASKRP